MRTIDGEIRLSASDLMRFKGCRHATTLDLRHMEIGDLEPAADGDEAELLQKQGDDHELAFLETLKAEGRSIADIPKEGMSLEASVEEEGAAQRRLEGPAQRRPEDGPAQRRLEGIRIVVVDDLADTREILQLALGNEGARVVAFARGADALEWLSKLATGSWPDLLVCDIVLADEDGHEVVRRLRQMEARLAIGLDHRLPAIALTGMAKSEDRLRALMAGFQVHLAKPVRIGELVAAIHRLVPRSAAMKPPDSTTPTADPR